MPMPAPGASTPFGKTTGRPGRCRATDLHIVPSHDDDRLIILRLSVPAKGAERRYESSAQCFGGRDVKAPHQIDQPVPTELVSSWICGFGDAVAVEQHNVARLRSDHQPVIGDARQEPKRQTGHAPWI